MRSSSSASLNSNGDSIACHLPTYMRALQRDVELFGSNVELQLSGSREGATVACS